MNITKGLILLVLGGVLAGCASNQEMYHWGEYQNLLQGMYLTPGQATAEDQIIKLNTDIQQSANSGKPVPPGIYAHLGVMYAAEGQPARAEEALIKEKELYPEATVLVDTLLKNQQKGFSK